MLWTQMVVAASSLLWSASSLLHHIETRVISGDSSHFLGHFSRLMCHIIHGLIAPPRVLYKYGPVSLQW